MSKGFRGWKIDEAQLFPPSVQDYVPKGHLSRLIVSLVRESLDLSAIMGSYTSGLGQPPFDPRLMTALLLHGYASGVYSSRRIARASVERADFMMIVAGDPPDFRTISEFRLRHLKALAALFVQVLKLAEKAGLVKLGHVALDGTKIKANASRHKAMSYERMKKREVELKAEVDRWLDAAEAADREEDKLYGERRVTPGRLNTSFGSIAYTDNNRYSNYESVYFEFKGRFSRRGFIDASYTRSKSQDDSSVYPTEAAPATYYGPSPWDVPNRFSLTLNYELPALNGGNGFAGHATGGWGVSGTSIFQSGYPAMVTNSAPFIALCQDGTTSSSNPTGCPSASNLIVTGAPGSGDYNADGDTTGVAGVGVDYPNVTSYHQGTSKSAFLNGAFSTGQFTSPTFGTEGNEKASQFRSPNFAETDLNLYKITAITERVNLQLRFEFFNLFNRVNLTGFDTNLADGTFGKATAQQLPRNWQVAARITF